MTSREQFTEVKLYLSVTFHIQECVIDINMQDAQENAWEVFIITTVDRRYIFLISKIFQKM